jgi:hypothetical protein
MRQHPALAELVTIAEKYPGVAPELRRWSERWLYRCDAYHSVNLERLPRENPEGFLKYLQTTLLSALGRRVAETAQVEVEEEPSYTGRGYEVTRATVWLLKPTPRSEEESAG